MWFLFGLVTIILCVGFELWRRQLSRWDADGKTRSGHDYKIKNDKGNASLVYLGVACPDVASFSIRRQSAWDAFCNRIGLSREYQTGDKDFDDAFYLVTDKKSLHYAISSSQRFRVAIQQMMNYGSASRLQAYVLHCRNGRLWIELSVGHMYAQEDIEFASAALCEDFAMVAKLVADVVQGSGSRWNDPFVVKAIVILAISSGSAINAVVQYVRHRFVWEPFTVDYTLILVDAIKYAVPLVVLLGLFTVFWLGRSARTHMVLLELSTIGALGIYLSLAFEVRDINIEWDINPPQVFASEVVRKYTSRSRRGGTSHYLIVKNWNCACPPYKFKVSSTTYGSAAVGRPVSITQHSGHLGYPWISKVTSY